MTPDVTRRVVWLRSPRGFLTRLRQRGPRRALLKVVRALRRLLEERAQRGVAPAFVDDFDWDGAEALTVRYGCRGNDAPMVLFVSADASDMARNRSLGWLDVHLGALTVHEVPGRHLSLLTEPHVHDVARALSTSLRAAQACAVSR